MAEASQDETTFDPSQLPGYDPATGEIHDDPGLDLPQNTLPGGLDPGSLLDGPGGGQSGPGGLDPGSLLGGLDRGQSGQSDSPGTIEPTGIIEPDDGEPEAIN